MFLTKSDTPGLPLLVRGGACSGVRHATGPWFDSARGHRVRRSACSSQFRATRCLAWPSRRARCCRGPCRQERSSRCAADAVAHGCRRGTFARTQQQKVQRDDIVFRSFFTDSGAHDAVSAPRGSARTEGAHAAARHPQDVLVPQLPSRDGLPGPVRRALAPALAYSPADHTIWAYDALVRGALPPRYRRGAFI
jgi:hypothetical protein